MIYYLFIISPTVSELHHYVCKYVSMYVCMYLFQEKLFTIWFDPLYVSLDFEIIWP